MLLLFVVQYYLLHKFVRIVITMKIRLIFHCCNTLSFQVVICIITCHNTVSSVKMM